MDQSTTDLITGLLTQAREKLKSAQHGTRLQQAFILDEVSNLLDQVLEIQNRESPSLVAETVERGLFLPSSAAEEDPILTVLWRDLRYVQSQGDWLTAAWIFEEIRKHSKVEPASPACFIEPIKDDI